MLHIYKNIYLYAYLLKNQQEGFKMTKNLKEKMSFPIQLVP